jgi:hypothetical protein
MIATDDETLMAFLDGELDEVRRARIERALAEDPTLRDRLEVQRLLRERLAAHYAPVVEEEVPERFRRMLESQVVDLSAARARRARPLWQSFAALAATLLLGLLFGRGLAPSSPVVLENGAMVARGELAQALDTQLASAPPAGARTRIGVTFARADGSLCRTFERAELAGLACREDSDWRLAATAAGAGESRSEYRQAGSGSARMLEAAQELMAGEPLDAEAERRARDSGWQAVPAAP